MVISKGRLLVITIGLVTSLSATVLADTPKSQSQRDFERAYFLESHEGDLEQAAEVYGRLAKTRDLPSELANEARTRRQRCLEDLRSADPAALMPAQSIVYAELRQPGRVVENLATMLGIVGDPLQNLIPSQRGPGLPIPDAPGVEVPPNVFLSPAILGELNRFRGAALAVTELSLTPGGEPDLESLKAVLILHPGDDEALRGAIVTAAQFVQPTDPIGGFPTIRIEPGVIVTFTERLVIAATDAGLVDGVVKRLTTGRGDSLADREEMQVCAQRRQDALAFAFVDAKGALKTIYANLKHHPQAMQQVGIAQGLMDLNHWQSLSALIGSSPEGLFAETVLALEDGHANLAYNLIRTPPMTGRSLQGVPAGAAAVMAIGINPASDQRSPTGNQANAMQYVTGLDLGRELFANIEEIAVFCLPGERPTGLPIPDLGIVVAANDPAKSQQLWDQLLTIPSLVMGTQVPEPTQQRIAGQEVRVYPMPEGVTLYVTQLEHGVVIGLTEKAITSTIDAYRTGRSVLTDAAVKAGTRHINEDTSILLLGHAGRCARMGAQFCPPSDIPHLQLISEALESTVVTVVADESPTRLRLAADVTGLPKMRDLLQIAGRMMNSQSFVDREEVIHQQPDERHLADSL